MPYSKPTPGQPALPYVANAPLWNDIIDMLRWWKDSQASQNVMGGYGKCLPIGHNTSGADMQPGQLAYIDSVYQPSADTPSGSLMKNAPIFKLINPVWHTKIDNLVLLHKPVLDDQVAHIFGPTIIPTSGTQVSASDRYCMPDPANPRFLKTADAGIFAVLGVLDDTATSQKFLIVDTTRSQPLWRYELTAAFSGGAGSTAAAKLLRIDGTVFANTATISDPDNLMSDQGSGDKGYCVHVGNKFIATEAVCE